MPITSSNVENKDACDNCIHKNSCKYSENFTRAFNVSLVANCKNYIRQSKVLILRNNS